MPFRKLLLEKSESFVRNPLTHLAVSFLLGLIIGLVVLGWMLWPVQYVDTTPEQLRSDYQLDYLRMTVDSYGSTRDANTARSRFDQMGLRKWDVLDALRSEAAVDPARMDPAKLKDFEILLANTTSTEPAGAGQPGEQNPQVVPGDVLPLIIGLGVLIGGAAAAVVGMNLRRRRRRVRILEPVDEDPGLSLEAEEEAAEIPEAAEGPAASDDQNEPLERFVTTYEVGNDVYEDSFTVNSPSGEFLGECGVGISEPIGVGGPKKVTAFEVWLFDRKPSRTSTVVLMSRHAFEKDDLRASLAPRGKPVLAEEGADFWLDTPGLQLRVLVRELRYGKGPLPENSFFEGLTLQMEVWSRAGKPS
jgi:hypothetical protein